MASILNYLTHHYRAYDPWPHTGQRTVRVTEVFEGCNNSFATSSCRSFEVGLLELKILLSANHVPDEGVSTNQKPVLRVIWFERLVHSQQLNVEKEIFDFVHAALGHDAARNGCSSTLAGIGSIEATLDRPKSYYLSFMPKMTMTWSRSIHPDVTTIVCIAEDKKTRVLESLLEQPFVQRLHAQFMLPILLAAVLFSVEIDKTQEKVKQEVRRTEVRTGHHDWKSRAEQPALGDLVGLAAKMSGCSTRMASCMRKQKILLEILSFAQTGWSLVGKNDQQPSEIMKILRIRSAGQQIDTDFVNHRIRTQLEALYHLVSQNDAFSAQEMAQDTRLIAIASQRDSSSMKCIAIVTMFFLPGTFVASLLSIPLYDWDADTREQIFRPSHSGPVLVTFSAITLPMMALVFAIWGLWRFFEYIQKKSHRAKSLAKLQHTLLDDEARKLASKRGTLSANDKRQ